MKLSLTWIRLNLIFVEKINFNSPTKFIIDTFELKYNESGWNFFGKGGLCMSVNSNSKCLRTYSNIYGEVLDRNLLRGFNSVKIKVDTSNSSNTFNFI